MNFTPIAKIKCSTSDTYWREKSISVYGSKASYQYLLGFDEVLIEDNNFDTGEVRLVLVKTKDFYNELEYKGTFNGSILNVFRH